MRKGTTKAADYWALGVLIFEMLVGDPPFKSLSGDPWDTFRRTLSGRFYVPNFISESAADLIYKLLQVARGFSLPGGVACGSPFAHRARQDSGPDLPPTATASCCWGCWLSPLWLSPLMCLLLSLCQGLVGALVASVLRMLGDAVGPALHRPGMLCCNPSVSWQLPYLCTSLHAGEP